jgi:hypothetical protein
MDDAVAAAVEEPAERQWLEARLAPLLGLAGEGPPGRARRSRTRPTPPSWPASAATRSTPSRSAACSTTGACWSATAPRCGSRPPTRSSRRHPDPDRGRLDTLPPEGRALLQDAAVVGTVFWSGALSAIGGRDPAATEATPGELARRAFIRAAGRSSVAGEGDYAFWHTLTREVAYGQLPRTARIAKHRAVAAWIERVAGDRIADHAELLAHHYLTVGVGAGVPVRPRPVGRGPRARRPAPGAAPGPGRVLRGRQPPGRSRPRPGATCPRRPAATTTRVTGGAPSGSPSSTAGPCWASAAAPPGWAGPPPRAPPPAQEIFARLGARGLLAETDRWLDGS